MAPLPPSGRERQGDQASSGHHGPMTPSGRERGWETSPRLVIMAPWPRQGERGGRPGLVWSGWPPAPVREREAGRPGLVCIFQQGGRRATGHCETEFLRSQLGVLLLSHRPLPSHGQAQSQWEGARKREAGPTSGLNYNSLPQRGNLTEPTQVLWGGPGIWTQTPPWTQVMRQAESRACVPVVPVTPFLFLLLETKGESRPPPVKSRSLGGIGWKF